MERNHLPRGPPRGARARPMSERLTQTQRVAEAAERAWHGAGAGPDEDALDQIAAAARHQPHLLAGTRKRADPMGRREKKS